MFTSIFRWELRSLRRDPAVWLALLVALAALGFALANGTRWLGWLDRTRTTATVAQAKAQADAVALAAKLNADPTEKIPAFRDPRLPAVYANSLMAHYATLPATPLAALTTGQSDLLPAVIPLSPGANPALGSAADPENPHRLLIGRFDAAFAVVYLAPLLILALTYALVSGERERGTLALQLAQPLRALTLVLSRAAPRALLALGLLALLALGALAFAGAGTALPRLTCWSGVALAYGGFWFALALAVAARPGTSATHALTLAALWLGFVVLVPAGINLAVKTLRPVPSRLDLVLAMRHATDAASADRSRVLAAYLEDHPEFAPADPAKAVENFTLLRLATNARVDRDLAPVLAGYATQLAAQQALVGKLQFLSPALLAQNALADAAGTGLVRHQSFVAQSRAHHAALREFFTPRIVKKEAFAAWEAVPHFTFVEETPAVVARNIVPPLLGLLIGAFVLAAASTRTLCRLTA